jgi:1,4-dihydroxy-2-naphthoyl-CoA hydrolase
MRDLAPSAVGPPFGWRLSWPAMSPEPSPAVEQGFDQRYGLAITQLGDGEVTGEVLVRDELKQPAGLIHGGVYAAIAESLAVAGTEAAVSAAGRIADGFATSTSFLRPITQGTIHAHARARHRGRTTWVWEVDITDDAGRLCVLARATVTVRLASA